MTRTWRWWGVVLAVLVAAGCGDVGEPAPAGPRGERVDAELVVLIDKVHATPVGAVLDDPEDLLAFPGRFDSAVSSQLTAALRGREPDRDRPLVGIARTVGCGGYGGAELRAVGADLQLHLRDPKEAPEECYAPFSVVAVFAVPQRYVAGDVTFEGAAPHAPGPGKLVLFRAIRGGQQPAVAAADLASEGDRARFLAALPTEAAAQVRAVTAASPASDARTFGFVLAGCAEETALLVVDRGASSAYAVLSGGQPTNCEVAQYFVAVFVDDSAATRGVRPVAPR